MGKITINTEVASSVVAEFKKSSTLLENNISGKVNNSLQPLIDLGLVSVCPGKIEGLNESIVTSEKTLIHSISSHISDVINDEEKLKAKYNDGYSKHGGRYSDGGHGSTGSNTGSNIDVDNKEDGKKIKAEDLSSIIDSFDSSTKDKLLELIKINNNDKTKYIDLFLDTKNSEELFVLLKKSFKSDYEFVDFTADDIKMVQKQLLTLLFDSNIDMNDYVNNSIMISKDYLIDVSVKNNISVGDLLLDEKYKDILKDALENLYNGIDASNFKEESEGFIKYVDSVADNNNTSADSIINNNIELLL